MAKLKSWLIGILLLSLVVTSACAQTTRPIALLGTGQSNLVWTPDYPWSPDRRASIWNWDGVDGHVGTAFAPLSDSKVNLASKIASDIAARTGRPVCLVNISVSGIAIAHWIGTPEPDMRANLEKNVPRALEICGVSRFDGLIFWQGEGDNVGLLNPHYEADFANAMDWLHSQPWLPKKTPMIVYGLCSVAECKGINPFADRMNDVLRRVVKAEPAHRRFINTPSLHGPRYWDKKRPGHMTGQGYFSAGELGSRVLLELGRQGLSP